MKCQELLYSPLIAFDGGIFGKSASHTALAVTKAALRRKLVGKISPWSCSEYNFGFGNSAWLVALHKGWMAWNL